MRAAASAVGSLLPVFVVDAYEGSNACARSWITDDELATYLRANEEALRAAAAFHRPEVAFVGHAIPGRTLGRRALEVEGAVVKMHGSDLEYAVRPRSATRMRPRGAGGARAVVGASADVIARATDACPGSRSSVASWRRAWTSRRSARARAPTRCARSRACWTRTPRSRTASLLDDEVERALDARTRRRSTH